MTEQNKIQKSNKKFAETNVEFQTACSEVGLNPSVRQASKWRNKKGKAYKARYVEVK